LGAPAQKSNIAGGGPVKKTNVKAGAKRTALGTVTNVVKVEFLVCTDDNLLLIFGV